MVAAIDISGRPLPVVGAVATMPSRAGSLRRMLARVLPQLDTLFVYLDGFDRVPADLAADPRCRCVLTPGTGSLHAASRFLAPAALGADAVFCLFDDDILYPPDYVATITRALASLDGAALVGYHATVFVPPHRSYVRDRRTLHFAQALARRTVVHELGSGTLAFVSTRFRPDPARRAHADMNDLYVAAEALDADLPLVALERAADWLVPIAEHQDDSLWRATVRDERRQTELMRYVIARHVLPVRTDWWTGR